MSIFSILPLTTNAEENTFTSALEESTKGMNLSKPTAKGKDGLQEFIFDFIDKATPVVILIGILMAFIGAYKVMWSEDSAKIKEWTLYIVAGVVGIILIVSAKFIGTTLVEKVITNGEDSAIVWIHISQSLYDELLLPFIKVAIYLSAGFLFFILVGRVWNFLFSSDEWAKTKAGGMILWTVIGIAIMLLAKELIVAVFGKREAVLNQNADNLGDLGEWALNADFSDALPLSYTIINWIMGITALVILVMIIIQTIQMITKPEDTELVKKMKNTLIYIFIGIIIIGAWYFISNFLIIDGQS